MNSRIISWSSINLLLAIVSNVDPWNLFNSHISLRLFSWASRNNSLATITVHEENVDLVDVVLLLEHDEILLLLTKLCHSTFEHFFGHNHPGTRLFESPLDIQRGFTRFVNPKWVLICSRSEFCLWISWPCAWLSSRKTTGDTVLSWLTDDKQDDKPSPSE